MVLPSLAQDRNFMILWIPFVLHAFSTLIAVFMTLLLCVLFGAQGLGGMSRSEIDEIESQPWHSKRFSRDANLIPSLSIFSAATWGPASRAPHTRRFPCRL